MNIGQRITPTCQKQGETVGTNPWWVYGNTSNGLTGWIPSWYIDYPDNVLPGVAVCANVSVVVPRPAAVVDSGGNLNVIARGTDNKLHHTWQNKTNAVWTYNGAIATNIAGDPAVVVASDGNLNMFARGTDNKVHQTWQNKTNGVWTYNGAIATNIAGDPTAVVASDGNLNMFARGTDDKLHQTWQNKNTAVWTYNGTIG